MADKIKNRKVDQIIKDKKAKEESKEKKTLQKIDELSQKNEQLQAKVDELSDTVLRSHAERDNIRKRTAKEMENAVNFANTEFVKDLMEVMENFHRGLESIEALDQAANPGLKTVREGIEMTKASLDKTFEKHKIERINPLDQPFDHNLHQAIQQVDDESAEPGTVINVMQAGYVLKGRVLRPAMVVVAK